MAKASHTGSCNIKVGVRLRPLIAREASEIPKWKCKGNTVFREESGKTVNCFMFDKVYDSTATNNDIFTSIVKPLIDKAVEGFNATILAYGQTSSGKTYTMMGEENSKGLVPLCMDYIFQSIEKLPDERLFILGVSFLEVYNEKIRDLLAPEKTDLRLYETVEGDIKVDCRTDMVANQFEMMDLLEQGNQNKAIGETNMNERSSRSHTIFRITVESREKSGTDEECVRVSHINLVDLAGSERAAQTGTSGQRYKEGCAINRSLLQLGNVVQKLSEGKGEFIDYRSSKLTRMLQPSLSGNAVIVMICNITSVAVEQTQCTLQFANRAMSIKLSPHLNEVMDDATLIKRHAKRIKELETKLKDAEQLEEKNQTLQKEMDKLREMVILSSLHVKENQERALRRQTWGGLELRRKHVGLPTLHEEPHLLSRPFPLGPVSERFLHLDSIVEAHGDSMNVSSLSSEEQPSSMSLESRFSLGSNVSTRVSLDPETPPSVLRSRILQLQKKVDNSGTPQSVLRQRISMLQTQVSQLSTSAGTSSELLRERLGVLSDSPKTPVSAMKERFDSHSTPVTPPQFLREQINRLERHLETLEKDYKTLQEFTTLERQYSVEEIQNELESLRHSLHDYETMYLESSKNNAELKDENDALRETLDEMQTELENTKKELDTNKLWGCKNNEQQMQWKKELTEYKEKLTTLTNESKDWRDEKDLLRDRYEGKIAELQESLSEAWAQQQSLQATLDDKPVVATSDNDCQTSKDEEECEKLREEMFFKDQDIANLHMDLLTKQESLQYASAEIEKLKSELAQSNKTHAAQMQQKEQELRAKFEELSVQKITVAVADIKINQEHLTDLTNNPDYESVTHELQEMTRNYEESQKEIQANKVAMKDMQNKMEELCEEHRLLQSELEGRALGVFEYQHDSWTALGPEVTAVELQNTGAHDNSSMLQSTVMYAPTQLEECKALTQTNSTGSQLEEEHKALTLRNAELTEELTQTLDIIKQQGLLLNLPTHLTGTSPEIGEFLTQNIRELLDTKASLESSMAALKVEVAQLQQDNADLASQLSEATAQASTCDALRKKLQEAPKSEEVASGVKRLVTEMRALNSSYSSEALNQMALPELIEKFIACIFEKQMYCFNKLQGDIQAMEEKNSKLKSDLREKLDLIRDLESSKSELLQQLSDAKTSEPEYKQQIDESEQLEVALGEMKQSYEALVEGRRSDAEIISELEVKLQLAREAAGALEQQMLELREQVGPPDGISAENTIDIESKHRNKVLEGGISEEMMHKLTKEKNQWFSQHSKLESAYKEQQEQFATVTSQLEARNQSMSELQSKLENTVTSCRTELEQLTSERDQALREKIQLEEQLTAKSETEKSPTKNVTGKTVESLTLELQQQINLSSSQAFKINKLEAERSKLEEQITTLTQKLTEECALKVQLETEKTKSDEQITTLTQKLAEECALKVQLETEKTHLEEEIATLTQKLTEESALKEQIETEKTKLEEKITTLTQKLTEESALKEQIETEKTKLEEKIAPLTQESGNYVTLQEQLVMKLQEAEVQENVLQEKITELQDQLQAQEQQATAEETLAAENAELNEKIAALSERNCEMEVALAENTQTQQEIVALKEQLTEVTERERNLKNTLETSKITVASLEKELEDQIAAKLALETDRQQLLDKISSLSEELETRGSEQELCQARESESQLQDALTDVKSQLGCVGSELNEQVSANQQLEEEKTSLDSQLKETKQHLTVLLSEYEKVSKELEGTQAQCEILERELAKHQQLSSQLDEATETQENLKRALQESEVKLVNLKSELDLQVEANEQMTATKSHLQQELQQLEVERLENHKTLSAKYKGLEEELTSFQTLHAQLKSDLESEHQLRAETQTHLTQVEAQLKVLNTQYTELETKHSSIQQENEDLHRTVSQLQTSLLEAEKFNETFKTQLVSQEQNIQSLQKEIQQIQATKVELESAQRDTQQRLQVARAAQQEAELSCEKLRSDLTAAVAAQQETELVYEKYRSDLTAMTREFEEQGSMVESLQNDLAKSNMLLNAAQEDREMLCKRLEKAHLEIEEQKVGLENAEDEFQDMLKSYRDNTEKRIHFEEQVCKFEIEVDELQAKIAAYEKEALRQKSNPEISQQSLAHFQQELQAKSARLAELEREAEDSKHVVAKYEAESMELRRNLADTKGELALLERKIVMDDLPHQREAESCRREVTYLEQKVRNLQSELRHLRSQLQQQDSTFHHDGSRRRVQSAAQATQTSAEQFTCSVAVQAPPDNETLWDRKDGYLPSSAITEAGRMYGMKQQLDETLARNQKLESERSMFKDELRKRNKMIFDLQLTLTDPHRTLANKENKGNQKT